MVYTVMFRAPGVKASGRVSFDRAFPNKTSIRTAATSQQLLSTLFPSSSIHHAREREMVSAFLTHLDELARVEDYVGEKLEAGLLTHANSAHVGPRKPRTFR